LWRAGIDLSDVGRNLQKLDIGQQDLAMATNAGDWKAYRAKWAELLPVLKEMEAAALASRNAVGAANILSLYRADLGLFLQNAGLGPAANLDEFSARISGGLDGQRPAAAATAGVNVVQQSVTRGVEFVKGLAAAEGDKVLAEYRGQAEQKAATRREQLSGKRQAAISAASPGASPKFGASSSSSCSC